MVLHIPLAESRKVGSRRRAVGAVDVAERTSFSNPKTLIPCSLAFWVPDLGFGCGIMAKNRLSHTRLSCLKVPLSCKISRFCPDFPVRRPQFRDFPGCHSSCWRHGKKSRFYFFHFLQVWKDMYPKLRFWVHIHIISSISCKFGKFFLSLPPY